MTSESISAFNLPSIYDYIAIHQSPRESQDPDPKADQDDRQGEQLGHARVSEESKQSDRSEKEPAEQIPHQDETFRSLSRRIQALKVFLGSQIKTRFLSIGNSNLRNATYLLLVFISCQLLHWTISLVLMLILIIGSTILIPRKNTVPLTTLPQHEKNNNEAVLNSSSLRTQISGRRMVRQSERREIPRGSSCEKYDSIVSDLFNQSFDGDCKFAAKKLDEIEAQIEKACPPHQNGVNPEIFFKMGFIYFRVNLGSKYFKWLTKVEEINYWTHGRSVSDETMVKTYIILASWHLDRAQFDMSEDKLEKGQKLFKENISSSHEEFLYLKNWLTGCCGILSLAKYLSLNLDPKEKASVYKRAEEYLKATISERIKAEKPRLAGSAQFDLARLYVKAGEYDKAEDINNEGKKNVLPITNRIYSLAVARRNDALIAFGRGKKSTAKEIYQEVLDFLEGIFPTGNDLSETYKKEFFELFQQEYQKLVPRQSLYSD